MEAVSLEIGMKNTNLGRIWDLFKVNSIFRNVTKVLLELCWSCYVAVVDISVNTHVKSDISQCVHM